MSGGRHFTAEAIQTTGISVICPRCNCLNIDSGIPRGTGRQVEERHHGTRVTVAGSSHIDNGQKTAAGVTFISLEDDTGLINVVCLMDLWQRHKQVARSAVALLVRGYLESADGAINVVARELEDLVKLHVTPRLEIPLDVPAVTSQRNPRQYLGFDR